MSPTWQLWDDSPTYIAGVSGAAVIQTVLWVTALAVTGWLFWRRPAMAPGGSAALVATTAAVVAVISGRFDERCPATRCNTAAF